jgi:hypothetical protein
MWMRCGDSALVRVKVYIARTTEHLYIVTAYSHYIVRWHCL